MAWSALTGRALSLRRLRRAGSKRHEPTGGGAMRRKGLTTSDRW